MLFAFADHALLAGKRPDGKLDDARLGKPVLSRQRLEHSVGIGGKTKAVRDPFILHLRSLPHPYCNTDRGDMQRLTCACICVTIACK